MLEARSGYLRVFQMEPFQIVEAAYVLQASIGDAISRKIKDLERFQRRHAGQIGVRGIREVEEINGNEAKGKGRQVGWILHPLSVHPDGHRPADAPDPFSRFSIVRIGFKYNIAVWKPASQKRCTGLSHVRPADIEFLQGAE